MGEILADEICGVKSVTMMDNEARFQQALDALGVTCDPKTAGRLATYQALLAEWNERINLTGDASLEATLDRHFMDSLAPLKQGELMIRGACLIDVGSGAGFPGLPLAIARPDLQVTLLDSLRKRLLFLDEVIAQLNLTNVRTLHARAEDAGRELEHREGYDLAVARAVAPAPVLLELLLPLTRIGGKAICYKGPSAAEELDAAARASRLLGGGPVRSLPVTIPGHDDWQHCVLVIDKRERTPRLYPRKAGTPERAPLGGGETGRR